MPLEGSRSGERGPAPASVRTSARGMPGAVGPATRFRDQVQPPPPATTSSHHRGSVMASPTATDPVLLAERAHLLRAREQLGRMRERAERIADYGVDELASYALGAVRARRLRALADDPSVPPFFGRLDRPPDVEHPAGETFHAGRR